MEEQRFPSPRALRTGRVPGLVLWFLFLAAIMAGEEFPWTRPASTWSEKDASQVLQSSPWSKAIVAGIAPLQNEAQRREGGGMGLPKGIGYDEVADTRGRISLPDSVFGKSDPTPRANPSPKIHLTVRWESALPVQAAELKAHELAPTTSFGDGYCVTVYGIPGTYFGDPVKLGSPLKNLAEIQRAGKRSEKPSRVEVYQLDGGAAVVYIFSRLSDLSVQDGSVTFQAEIGRLTVSQKFLLADMQFEGKLQL